MSYEEIGWLCSRSRSQKNFKMSMNVCWDNIFQTAESFTTKLGMVMHHLEPEHFSKRLVCHFQGQGHSEGSYKHNMKLISIFWTADPFATKLILMYIIISWIVLWTDWIALLWSRSQEVQNSSECSSGRYLLSCWTFCDQTWYGDASSWAKVLCKKISLQYSRSKSQ